MKVSARYTATQAKQNDPNVYESASDGAPAVKNPGRNRHLGIRAKSRLRELSTKSLRRFTPEPVPEERTGEQIVPMRASPTVGIIVFGDSMRIRYINPHAQLLLLDHGNPGRAGENTIGMDIATLVAQLRVHWSGGMVSRITGPCDDMNSARTGQGTFRLRAITLQTKPGTTHAPVLVLIEAHRDPNTPARSAEHLRPRADRRISHEPVFVDPGT